MLKILKASRNIPKNIRPKTKIIKRTYQNKAPVEKVGFGWKVVVFGPLIGATIAAGIMDHINRNREDDNPHEIVQARIPEKPTSSTNIDVVSIAKKIAFVIIGQDENISFNFEEMKWIAAHNPEDTKYVKVCDLDIRSNSRKDEASALLQKFQHLTTIRTNFLGTRLTYPKSLRHLHITLTEPGYYHNIDLSLCGITDIELEKLEIVYNGSNAHADVALNSKLPCTLKTLRIIAPKARLWLDYYNYAPSPGQIWTRLDYFDKLEILDVKSQIIYCHKLPQNLKYLRCNIFNWDQELKSLTLGKDLEHFEVNSIQSDMCELIVKNSPKLKVLKGDCIFSQQMMELLPKKIQTLSLGGVHFSLLSNIPDSCADVTIGEILGMDDCNTFRVVKWPSNLQSLKVGGKFVNPLLYRNLPKSTTKLYLTEDQFLTDLHITLGDAIPPSVKYLVLEKNENVTVAGLRGLIQRGCEVIVDIKRNKANTKEIASKLKRSFEAYETTKL
jgi:hypothetical protein